MSTVRKLLLSRTCACLTLLLGWACVGIGLLLLADNLGFFLAVAVLCPFTIFYVLEGLELREPIDGMLAVHTCPRMSRADVLHLTKHPEKLVELLELSLAHNNLRVVVEERVGSANSGGLPGNDLSIRTFKIRRNKA